jgi:hypothetical protein
VADLLAQSLRVIDRLNARGVDYVVIGGVAMNVHGLVRGTEDLDLFLRPDAENRDTVRPIDHADAEVLRRTFDLDEEP